MSYVFLVLALFVFMFLLGRLRLVTKVKGSVADLGAAVAVMRSADTGEAEKERAIRQATLRMWRLFGDILVRSAVALLVPAALVFAGIAVGLYGSGEAVAAAGDPYFLVALTVLAIGMLRFAR
jgi:hypothetical protein